MDPFYIKVNMKQYSTVKLQKNLISSLSKNKEVQKFEQKFNIQRWWQPNKLNFDLIWIIDSVWNKLFDLKARNTALQMDLVATQEISKKKCNTTAIFLVMNIYIFIIMLMLVTHFQLSNSTLKKNHRWFNYIYVNVFNNDKVNT